MRTTTFAFVVLLLVAVCTNLHAQQVAVRLYQPPPNQLRESDIWRLDLVNLTQRSLTIYLQGVANEERDGLIIDAQSSSFTLPPGSISITATRISPITVNQSNSKYRSSYLRTGIVPAGTYTICVYARLANGEEVGSDCIEHRVDNFSPPVLLSPADDQIITDSLPVFTWLPPAPFPVGQQVVYDLKVVEIVGQQSPEEAIERNQAFFERKGLTSPILQYPLSGRRFDPERRYTWKVEARVEISSLGHSEVWRFNRNRLDLSNKDIAPFLLSASIAAGWQHSVGIRGTKPWAWGRDLYTQNTANHFSPVQINLAGGKVVKAAAGAYHSLIVTADGRLWTWGMNDYGQLGNSTLQDNLSGANIDLGGVRDVAAGDRHSLALTEDGAVWAWGYNRSGELGTGTLTDTASPARVASVKSATAIAAGRGHSLALAQGAVWAWGSNNYGQVGTGSEYAFTFGPARVEGLPEIIAIAAGDNFSLALARDGTVWAWGANSNGQLGIASTTDTSRPAKIAVISKVVAIAAHGAHCLALKDDGTVWSWGSGYHGALGTGVRANVSAPVQIASLTNVKSIATGAGHSIAVKKDGTIWVWGTNMSGQLGTGMPTSGADMIVDQPKQLTGW